MFRSILLLAGCVAIFLQHESVSAQNLAYEVTIEAGIAASDNIGRTADTDIDPAVDETIYLPALSFMLLNVSQRWDADIQGTVRRHIYENQTFEDETLSTVRGNVSIHLAQWLDWVFNVNHGQQLLNPFEPVRPDNRENVTVLSTGPGISIPIGVRTYITGSGTYTDVSYETRPFDNERIGGGLGLRRDISPEKSVSLNVDADRIEYEFDLISPPIDRQNAFLGYDVNGDRNNFALRIGWNRIEREGDEADGIMIAMDWTRDISTMSVVNVNLGSKYSADGDIFRLNQELDNRTNTQGTNTQGTNTQRTDTQDVQGITDPFRYDHIRIAYAYSTPRTRVRAGVHFGKESHENANAFDREVSGVDLLFSRDFSRALNGSVDVRFIDRNYGTVDFSDEDTTVGIALRWNISQKISLVLRGEKTERQSNSTSAGYDETRATATFRFTPLRRR
jgi:hypothetical protein